MNGSVSFDPKISRFVWKGNRPAPLAEVSPMYRLRYSHEHGYRFDKQELFWHALWWRGGHTSFFASVGDT